MKFRRLSSAILVLFLVAASATAGMYRFGPAGGTDGGDWIDTQNPGDLQISEIRVWTGRTIDGIQMVAKTADGVRDRELHGQTTNNLQVFKIEDGEYLTAISGRCGGLVDSITARTNTGRTSPRMGGTGGYMDFHFEAPPGFQIIGIFGRGNRSISSLGVVVTEAPVN